MRDRIQAIIGDCEEEVVEETFDLLNGGVIVPPGLSSEEVDKLLEKNWLL